MEDTKYSEKEQHLLRALLHLLLFMGVSNPDKILEDMNKLVFTGGENKTPVSGKVLMGG